jgi:hypothetical protein
LQPEAIRRIGGEVSLDEIGSGRSVAIAARGDRPFAPAHAGQLRRTHQASDSFASDAHSVSAELGMDPRHAVCPSRAIVNRANLVEQRGIHRSRSTSWRKLDC